MKKFVCCIALASAACATSSDTTPSAQEVNAQFTVSYQRPALHAVQQDFEGPARDDVMLWSRTYDGVPMLVDSKSARMPDGSWELHYWKDLKEPDPVNHATVLSFNAAADALGLGDDLASGIVGARLVYRPTYAFAPGKTIMQASDVELVIDHYTLAIELDNASDGTRTYVDAYSGEVMTKESSWLGLTDNLTGTNYGVQSINTMPGPRTVVNAPHVYQDTVRDTNEVCAGSTCGFINGQGISSDNPPAGGASGGQYHYAGIVSGASYQTDLAFSLARSWDYYLDTFSFRGLKGQQPGPGLWANDAVIYFGGATTPTTNAVSGLINMSISGMPFESTLDTIGHEYTHGVYSWNTNNLVGSYHVGSDGGMQEANSDLFGELIKAFGLNYIGKQSTLDIQDGWIFGQPANASGKTELTRDMCTPSASENTLGLANPVDTWSSAMDDPNTTISAYVALGPFDRVFCLLGQGMVPFGSTYSPELQSYLTPAGFAPLTGPVVGRLQYLATLALGLTAKHPYVAENFRDAMVAAAQSQFGAYSPQYKAVQDAYAVVGIGPVADRIPPTITLASPTTITSDVTEIVANVTPNPSGAAITQVMFQVGNGTMPTLLHAPPWQIPVPPMPYGPQPLYITASDAHYNNASATFTLNYEVAPPTVTIVDATPCGVSPNGPACEVKGTRTYTVTATDSVYPVTKVQLQVNGLIVASSPGSSATFNYTFTGDELQYVVGVGVDSQGDVGTALLEPVPTVDAVGPTVTSGPTFSEDQNTVGRGFMTFCATDPSWISGWDMSLDGAAFGITTYAVLVAGQCWEYDFNTSVGAHSYVFHVYDMWDNETDVPGSFLMTGGPPTLQTPIVTKIGAYNHINVTTQYAAVAPATIAKVQLLACEPTCVVYDTFTPTSSPADQTGHVFSESVGGGTQTMQVIVTDSGGKTATKTSVPYNIPVAVAEKERNDSTQTSTAISSSPSELLGTFNGILLGAPYSGYWDYDYFKVVVPANQTLTVTSAFNCAKAEVAIEATDGTILDEQPANGNLNESWPAGASGATFWIYVDFQAGLGPTLTGFPASNVPGCSAPAYNINVSY